MTDPQPERRPIGWWLKTADARIEQAFEVVFDSEAITRRQWQVLEAVCRVPVPESELLYQLEAFADAQDAVDELRSRGLLSTGSGGVLTPTDAGRAVRDSASVGVEKVRSLVGAALPGDNYTTLIRLLADLVDGLDRATTGADRPPAGQGLS